jgi:NarL family two-component system response regulator LiaR
MSTPHHAARTAHAAHFDRPPLVLIADDHPLFAQALRHALTDWNFEVIDSARNGAEAVALAAVHQPDVILMDVHMPGIDGIEATRQIRVCSPASRVIAITSDDSPVIAEAVREAGASSVLLKTCAADTLLESVLHAAADVVPFRFAGAA